jgi:hypothetical protein
MNVTFQYATKFLCGPSHGREVVPGLYLTAINIHNPNEVPVEFRWKVAIALPLGQSGTITKLTDPRLIQEDGAVEIDCEQIRDLITSEQPPDAPPLSPFLKGFVVIESACELDVVAVYTAMGNTQQVETLHTERVPARRRERCLPAGAPPHG